MGFDLAEFGLRRVSPPTRGFDLSEFGLRRVSEAPDEPVINEQHPDIGWGTRASIMNLTANEDQAKRELEKKDFEVKKRSDKPYDFAVRRPGEAEWRVLDPSGFDLSDITDVLGGASNVAAQVGGGLLGGGLAAETGPGAFAAGVAGAGAASAAEEGARTYLGGKLAGFDPSLGEAGMAALREGAWGVAGEAGGRALAPLLPAAGRAIKKGLGLPLALEKKATGEDLRRAFEAARAAQTGSKAAESQAELRAASHIRDVSGVTDEEIARNAAARWAVQNQRLGLTREAANLTARTAEPLAQKAEAKSMLEAAKFRAASEAEAESARLEAEAVKRAGKPKPPVSEGGSLELASSLPRNVIEELEAIAPHQPHRITFDGTVLDPRSSFVAEVLKKVPRIRRATQESFGYQFASDIGSLSMDARDRYWANMTDDLFKKGWNTWIGKMAELALDSKEAAMLAPHIRRSLGRVLQGGRLTPDLGVLNDVLETIIKKTKMPDYLRKAIGDYKATIPGAAAATAQRARGQVGLSAGRADVAATMEGLVPPRVLRAMEGRVGTMDAPIELLRARGGTRQNKAVVEQAIANLRAREARRGSFGHAALATGKAIMRSPLGVPLRTLGFVGQAGTRYLNVLGEQAGKMGQRAALRPKAARPLTGAAIRALLESRL